MFFLISIQSIPFHKLLMVLLVSAVKFGFAPFLSFYVGFNFVETFALTSVGGIIGVFFFYFLSAALISSFKHLETKWGFKLILFKRTNRKRKVFSFRNRLLVRMKSNFGIIGIAILTPILISIPIGALLARRYYAKNRITIPLLIISVCFWSFVISLLIHIL
ncbi:MAG: hypothetical protein WCH34_03190 [Bacteroidota bacterium]